MTAHLNLVRPSPDRIIEENRPHRRDWFDAYADYAVTGDVVYRAERLAHEQSDDDPTGAMAAVVWLLGGIAVVGRSTPPSWAIACCWLGPEGFRCDPDH